MEKKKIKINKNVLVLPERQLGARSSNSELNTLNSQLFTLQFRNAHFTIYILIKIHLHEEKKKKNNNKNHINIIYFIYYLKFEICTQNVIVEALEHLSHEIVHEQIQLKPQHIPLVNKNK